MRQGYALHRSIALACHVQPTAKLDLCPWQMWQMLCPSRPACCAFCRCACVLIPSACREFTGIILNPAPPRTTATPTCDRTGWRRSLCCSRRKRRWSRCGRRSWRWRALWVLSRGTSSLWRTRPPRSTWCCSLRRQAACNSDGQLVHACTGHVLCANPLLQSWQRPAPMYAALQRAMSSPILAALFSLPLTALSRFPPTDAPFHCQLQLGPGDLILLASTTYPAVRSAAARVAAQRGAALLEVELLSALAGPTEAVLQRFEAALQAGGPCGEGGQAWEPVAPVGAVLQEASHDMHAVRLHARLSRAVHAARGLLQAQAEHLRAAVLSCRTPWLTSPRQPNSLAQHCRLQDVAA